MQSKNRRDNFAANSTSNFSGHLLPGSFANNLSAIVKSVHQAEQKFIGWRDIKQQYKSSNITGLLYRHHLLQSKCLFSLCPTVPINFLLRAQLQLEEIPVDGQSVLIINNEPPFIQEIYPTRSKSSCWLLINPPHLRFGSILPLKNTKRLKPSPSR